MPLRLIVQPAVTWRLVQRVLDMVPVWAASAVILAAPPTAAILVSTVVCLVTLSLLFLSLGIG